MTISTFKKRFRFQLIPPNLDQPINRDFALMWEAPSERELRRAVEPLLGGFTMIRLRVLVGEDFRDMFVDALAGPKELPRNERATEFFRAAILRRHPRLDVNDLPEIAGTAILFDEKVWLD
jgi:hypothetical protein